MLLNSSLSFSSSPTRDRSSSTSSVEFLSTSECFLLQLSLQVCQFEGQKLPCFLGFGKAISVFTISFRSWVMFSFMCSWERISSFCLLSSSTDCFSSETKAVCSSTDDWSFWSSPEDSSSFSCRSCRFFIRVSFSSYWPPALSWLGTEEQNPVSSRPVLSPHLAVLLSCVDTQSRQSLSRCSKLHIWPSAPVDLRDFGLQELLLTLHFHLGVLHSVAVTLHPAGQGSGSASSSPFTLLSRSELLGQLLVEQQETVPLDLTVLLQRPHLLLVLQTLLRKLLLQVLHLLLGLREQHFIKDHGHNLHPSALTPALIP
ncbi:hypothetical protein F7725_001821 [Dissostichus mawsoni]|uniref:Uncharacterized protein n=1 Tax=Dissostichus mawsoni TaxID=36200 RepID=A0A7J5Y0N5_DISMA|nr:hypothetical protein F7725_001821 [Dissostichus mawsoni]